MRKMSESVADREDADASQSTAGFIEGGSHSVQ